MSIKKKKHIKEADGKPISSRFIIVTVLSVTVLILIILLIFSSNIDILGYIGGIFGNGIGNNDSQGSQGSSISDIKGVGEADIIYETHDGNAYDVLMSLSESEVYSRIFRVIYTENENTFMERSTITKKGELFRVENSYITYIYNGSSLYIKEPTYTTVENGVFNIYDLIGITSLSYVKDNATADNVYFKDENNQKTIIVEIRTGAKLYNEYEVSVETGLVLSERSYYNGTVYRSVITDKIEITEHTSPADDLFVIPEA